jgi:hypothetical protein
MDEQFGIRLKMIPYTFEAWCAMDTSDQIPQGYRNKFLADLEQEYAALCQQPPEPLPPLQFDRTKQFSLFRPYKKIPSPVYPTVLLNGEEYMAVDYKEYTKLFRKQVAAGIADPEERLTKEDWYDYSTNWQEFHLEDMHDELDELDELDDREPSLSRNRRFANEYQSLADFDERDDEMQRLQDLIPARASTKQFARQTTYNYYTELYDYAVEIDAVSSLEAWSQDDWQQMTRDERRTEIDYLENAIEEVEGRSFACSGGHKMRSMLSKLSTAFATQTTGQEDLTMALDSELSNIMGDLNKLQDKVHTVNEACGRANYTGPEGDAIGIVWEHLGDMKGLVKQSKQQLLQFR